MDKLHIKKYLPNLLRPFEDKDTERIDAPVMGRRLVFHNASEVAPQIPPRVTMPPATFRRFVVQAYVPFVDAENQSFHWKVLIEADRGTHQIVTGSPTSLVATVEQVTQTGGGHGFREISRVDYASYAEGMEVEYPIRRESPTDFPDGTKITLEKSKKRVVIDFPQPQDLRRYQLPGTQAY